jgi:hypothetical protein
MNPNPNQVQPEMGEIQPKSTRKKTVLEIDVWYRQGGAYTDRYDCEVIYGNADVDVEYDRQICEMNYPYRCPGVFRVRPLSMPVIIRCVGVDNTGNPRYYVDELYIFTEEGWKHVKVKEEYIWD